MVLSQTFWQVIYAKLDEDYARTQVEALAAVIRSEFVANGFSMSLLSYVPHITVAKIPWTEEVGVVLILCFKVCSFFSFLK